MTPDKDLPTPPDAGANGTPAGPAPIGTPAADKADNDSPTPPAGKAEQAGKGEGDKLEREERKVIQALKDITQDEDGTPETNARHITLAFVLGGDMLGGKWFRKNFLYILMVTAMLIVYVSNRYACQQEMITGKTLSDTLLDRRYKALTRSSELKERTRRSSIEQQLNDSTLQTANTPSYTLPLDEE